ncbi:CU044_2847 family protein [Frankia sp. CiP3]|uniref:CU044_2847 family protein n=1 Tax=Frankia sp. CiP3 TaxID=2880971 RepID=UPI001EF65155|nr:CU044_2847 family protein [Frankia sp. CiP3]
MDEDSAFEGWSSEVGVALAPAASVKVRPGGPGLEDASGAHRRRGPVVRRGEEAVRAAVAAVTGQISLVAAEVSRQLDGAGLVEPAPGQLSVDSVEVKFGVTLTAGSGKAIEAVLSVEGEAAVEVTVALARRPSCPPPVA